MSNRRFEMHNYRQVIFRMRSGQSDRSIAQAGIMGRTKCALVRQIAQRQGWLDQVALPAEEELAAVFFRTPASQSHPSTLTPFAEQIANWHQQGIRGTTIHQSLKRLCGFSGSYSAVRRFLKPLEKACEKPSCVLDFAPGEAAQVDFGRGPSYADAWNHEMVRTWIFVMTLCFSRHMFAMLVTNQSVATWLLCHRLAFEHFGGVPARLIIDNLKSAITRACYFEPEVQRSYAELALGYGFLISPCPPRDPKKKGQVESAVKYVKGSFSPLRDIRCLEEGNRQLSQWVLEVAGNRIHGTTRQRPLSLFCEAERHLLRPLPAQPVELAAWCRATVHGNCHVQFEKCQYSAPFRLVHQSLWLKATQSTVKLYRDTELVAIHPRLHRPGQRHTIDEHMPPEALAFKLRDPQWCLRQAETIGPGCEQLIRTLFADRVLDNLRAAQGVIGLARKYGPARLESACNRALLHDNVHYRSVKTILEKGLDQLPSETPLAPLPTIYTQAGRFLRPAMVN